MSKYNFTKYTTPKGLFAYPFLSKPDTKYVSTGEYKVDLSLTREDAKELVALMKAELKSYKEKNNISNGTDNFRIKKDEKEGTYSFKVKQKKFIPLKDGTQWEQKVVIVDAKGNPIPKDINIWSGTEGKLRIELKPYSMQGENGVSLKLKAVQVIKLVEGNSENESPFEEEEGYTTNNEPSPFSEENETKAEDTSDEEDF